MPTPSPEDERGPKSDCLRSFPFEIRSTQGDGQTLEGYAAVFNTPTRIDSWEGRFDEVIAPGAFRDAIAERTPVLMFEHGKHPLLGSLPLGTITQIREDAHGLFVQARLTDNWLVQPVRDAIRDGAVDGMSFRFSVADGGDSVEKRGGDVPLRTITQMGSVPELGPVVFPAYKPTTVGVRSMIDRLDGGDADDTPPGEPSMSPAARLLADAQARRAAAATAAPAADPTEQPDARSAGGGDTGKPGNGEPTPASPNPTAVARDRALRMKGIIR